MIILCYIWFWAIFWQNEYYQNGQNINFHSTIFKGVFLKIFPTDFFLVFCVWSTLCHRFRNTDQNLGDIFFVSCLIQAQCVMSPGDVQLSYLLFHCRVYIKDIIWTLWVKYDYLVVVQREFYVKFHFTLFFGKIMLALY